MREESHCVATDRANVLQIQNDIVVVWLTFKKSPQLGYRICLDSAA